MVKSKKKQTAGNLIQKLPYNYNLNIYAQPKQNFIPIHSFTGRYRIDGPLSRGDIVPKAIHQINLRKNIYPGGRKSKKSIKKYKKNRTKSAPSGYKKKSSKK